MLTVLYSFAQEESKSASDNRGRFIWLWTINPYACTWFFAPSSAILYSTPGPETVGTPSMLKSFAILNDTLPAKYSSYIFLQSKLPQGL